MVLERLKKLAIMVVLMNEKINVGGQAVIEGVMMRAPRAMAIAVRRPTGEITVLKEEIVPLSERFPVVKLPIVRGAVALFDAPPARGAAAAPPDSAEASTRFQTLAGLSIGLPRDDADFVPVEVRRQTFAGRPATSLRFRYAGEGYLLVVSSRDRLPGAPSLGAFPEGSFVSGERDGRSFVLWEREGAWCIVVSEVDVTLAFDLVRRLFS